MELSCSKVAAGIRLTQVLCPQAHGRKGFRHCTSCDRFTFASLSSIADATDEEAAKPKFRIAQVLTEGAGDGLLVAELEPVSESRGLGVAVARGVGEAREGESRFEISLEIESGGGCASCHGLCCGYWLLK